MSWANLAKVIVYRVLEEQQRVMNVIQVMFSINMEQQNTVQQSAHLLFTKVQFINDSHQQGKQNNVDICLEQTVYQVSIRRDSRTNEIYITSTTEASLMQNFLRQLFTARVKSTTEVLGFITTVTGKYEVKIELIFTSDIEEGTELDIAFRHNHLVNAYILPKTFSLTLTEDYPRTDIQRDVIKCVNKAVEYAIKIIQAKAILYALFGGGKLVTPVITFLFINMLDAFKYIDTKFPPNLHDLWLGITDDLFKLVQDKLQEHVIKSKVLSELLGPERFVYWETRAYILDNFITGIGLLALVFILWVIVKAAKVFGCIQPPRSSWLFAFEWSILLNFFYLLSLRMLIAGTVQIYASEFGDGAYALVSTIIGIVVVALYVLCSILLAFKIFKIQKILKITGTILGKENVFLLKKYRLYHSDLNTDNPDGLWIFQLISIRNIILAPVLVWADSTPYLQIVVFLLGNIAGIYLVAKTQAFKSKAKNRLYILNEALFVILVGLLIGVHQMNEQGSSISKKVTLGWIMMGIVLLILSIEMMKIAYDIFAVFVKRKKRNSYQKSARIGPKKLMSVKGKRT